MLPPCSLHGTTRSTNDACVSCLRMNIPEKLRGSNDSGYKNAAAQREHEYRAPRRRAQIATTICETDHRLATTIAMALRAFGEQLTKDAVEFQGTPGHSLLADDAKERADALTRLAD